MPNDVVFHQAFCSVMIEWTSGDTYHESRSVDMRRYPVGPPRDSEAVAIADAKQAEGNDANLPPPNMMVGSPEYRSRQIWPIILHEWA